MSAMRPGRRRFISATGVALSAPLVGLAPRLAAGAAASPSPEDVEAIRALIHQHATRLNARPDGFGTLERIEVAADRRSATATLPCLVEAAHAIGPDCPLVDMARQQGGGVVRRTGRVVFEWRLSKRDGAWEIQATTERRI